MWRFFSTDERSKNTRDSARKPSRNRRLGFEAVEARTMLSANTISSAVVDAAAVVSTVHGVHEFGGANTIGVQGHLTTPIATAPPASATATTTVLDTSASKATGGESITFTATIINGTAAWKPFEDPPVAITSTGTVTFMNGSTVLGTGTVKDGVATFSTTSLNAGNYTITAVYSGDSHFKGGASNAVAQSVAATATQLGLATSGNPSSPHGPIALTATVEYKNDIGLGPSLGTDNLHLVEPMYIQVINQAGSTALDAGGTVTFKDGSTTLGTATVKDGVATLTIFTQLPLNVPVTAIYSGNLQFQGSSTGYLDVWPSVLAGSQATPISSTTGNVTAPVTNVGLTANAAAVNAEMAAAANAFANANSLATITKVSGA